MPNNRKLILDKFQNYVSKNYIQYCEKHEVPINIEGVLTYLIDQQVIPNKSIQKYTILNEFKELYPKNEHQKTKTVICLANRFNISERSVWNLLRKVNQ